MRAFRRAALGATTLALIAECVHVGWEQSVSHGGAADRIGRCQSIGRTVGPALRLQRRRSPHSSFSADRPSVPNGRSACPG